MSQKIQKYIFKQKELNINLLDKDLKQLLVFKNFINFNYFFSIFYMLINFKKQVFCNLKSVIG